MSRIKFFILKTIKLVHKHLQEHVHDAFQITFDVSTEADYHVVTYVVTRPSDNTTFTIRRIIYDLSGDDLPNISWEIYAGIMRYFTPPHIQLEKQIQEYIESNREVVRQLDKLLATDEFKDNQSIIDLKLSDTARTKEVITELNEEIKMLKQLYLIDKSLKRFKQFGGK